MLPVRFAILVSAECRNHRIIERPFLQVLIGKPLPDPWCASTIGDLQLKFKALAKGLGILRSEELVQAGIDAAAGHARFHHP